MKIYKIIVLITIILLLSCNKEPNKLNGKIVGIDIIYDTHSNNGSINVLTYLELINNKKKAIKIFLPYNSNELNPYCSYKMIICQDTIDISDEDFFNTSISIIPKDTIRFFMELDDYNPYNYSLKDVKEFYTRNLNTLRILYEPNISYISKVSNDTHNYIYPHVVYQCVENVDFRYVYNNEVLSDTSGVIHEIIPIPKVQEFYIQKDTAK